MRRRRWAKAPSCSDAEVGEIVASYERGTSLETLRRTWGTNFYRLRRMLIQAGVEITKAGHRRKWQTWGDDETDRVVAAYEQGVPLTKIAAQWHTHHYKIQAVLHSAGVRLRGSGDLHRRYDVNLMYFDCIKDEQQAYWLGFLTADGWVQDGRRSPAVWLMLSVRDVDHLIKFRWMLDTDAPIRFKASGRHGAARIMLSGRRLVDGLERYGVGVRKTHSVRPAELDGDLMPAYWRGVFDGDGSIGQSRRDREEWQLQFAGNRAMVSGFAKWAAGVCGTRAQAYKHRNSQGWSVHIGGSDMPRRLAHALYRGASVYLDRKYELYQEMVAQAM